jgi:hypothetical protein
LKSGKGSPHLSCNRFGSTFIKGGYNDLKTRREISSNK